MRINWKALVSLGFAFWGLLCCTDLLGESTWRRCSYSFDDILKGQYNEMVRMHQESKSDEVVETPKQKMSWPVLFWNICAFLCSLIFCSMLRSMSWMVWRILKIYNVFRNRQALTNKIANVRNTEIETVYENEPQSNCKLIFKNQQFVTKEKMQEHLLLSKELDDVKKEKSELGQQLVMAQKENLTARQQIEEYKLETFMMKEKLARTANTLKENLKYKDFANANQEMISRKAHNLEMHLKEICRDRDILRSKLGTLEKSHKKVEDKLKMYEKQESDTNLEQFPEKDTTKKEKQEPNEFPQQPEMAEEMDISKFQKKIMELQRNIGTFETKKTEFETNSKISMDLEESSFDTSKDDSEEPNSGKKVDISLLKQNILNYNAYKTQMLRPKLKIGNIKVKGYSPPDTTGSSSDENSGPHRIISSTVEFQNFLKTLNSKSSLDFKRSSMF